MIYFDNAASTPVDKRVLEKIQPYFSECYSNPSNISNRLGMIANNDVEIARNTVAQFIGCYSQQIYWTSGATESNNIALQGAVKAFKSKYPDRKPKIITTSIEHKSVYETCEYLASNNVEVCYVEPECNGEVSIEKIVGEISKDTFLISVMMANNEIGVINDLKSICTICNEKDILVHTDATQIIGKQNVNVLDLGVDFLTFSGHKIYAPKGIGVLFVKNRNSLNPIVYGGGQENGLRSGTLNVSGIIGLAEACKLFMIDGIDEENKRLLKYRNIFENGLLAFSDKVVINGYNANRISNISNISFPVKEGYNILNILKEHEKIACSSGSACDSSDNKPSHVMSSLGKNRHQAKNTIRFSFGRFTTEGEITQALDHLILILMKIMDR